MIADPMLTELDIRLLDMARFERVLAALRRANDGEPDALSLLAEDCREALASADAARWHAGDAYFPANWLALVDAVDPVETDAPDAAAMARFGLLAVCLLAMPQYQRSVRHAPEASPNYLALGDEDGGLREQLGRADPWFEALTAELFERAEYHGALEPVIGVLTREEVAKLDALAHRLTPPEQAGPWSRDALERLRRLTRRCLENEAATLSVMTRL